MVIPNFGFVNFEEYLKSKKIDPVRYKRAESEQFEQFQLLFEQVHPDSFTHQKLFLINQIRRRFVLNEEVGAAKPAKNLPTPDNRADSTGSSEAKKPVFKPKMAKPRVAPAKGKESEAKEGVAPKKKPQMKPRVPSSTMAKKPVVKPRIPPATNSTEPADTSPAKPPGPGKKPQIKPKIPGATGGNKKEETSKVTPSKKPQMKPRIPKPQGAADKNASSATQEPKKKTQLKPRIPPRK